MTFDSIRTGLSERVIEIDDMINFIETQPIEMQSSRLSRSMKGLISILFYGCVEYVVTNTIKRMEQYITNKNMKLNEYNPLLISRFLDAQFESIAATGREQKWNSRFNFCKKIDENIIINSKLCERQKIPTDGKNIRATQLQSICQIYGLNVAAIIQDPSFKGRLDDIVNNRCFIAHGNNTAYEIGSKSSPNELKIRRDLINAFCTNFIEQVQNYIDTEQYKSA